MSRRLINRLPEVTVFRSWREVTALFQTTVCPADEEMRHVVMLMLIRVPMLLLLQNQRVIEERPSPSGIDRSFARYSQRGNDSGSCAPPDLRGILLMVRTAVEAHARAAFREQRLLG